MGELIPYYYLEFAADHFSTLLGADLEFPDPDKGGWPVHNIEDIEKADISFDKNGKWWQRTAEFADALKTQLGDEIMIAPPTLVGNLDALVALRGTNDLLMDLAMNPDGVKRALAQVNVAFSEIVVEFDKLFEFDKHGSINRHGFYSPKRMNVMQCDMSCMIGPEMFDEFLVPCFKHEMSFYDNIEYHLDGPDAIKHLEALCNLNKLDVIQWVPGDGEGADQDWTWLYEKIDSLGKGQILYCTVAEAKEFNKKLTSNKMIYYLHGSPTKTEIEDFIAELET